MVYIESWDEFAEAATRLYQQDPLKTRYVVKYRHCDGKLVLKVTDDVKCLKYKTDQQTDLKRMERLNNTFFALMATGSMPPADEGDTAMQEAAPHPVHSAPKKKSKQRRG